MDLRQKAVEPFSFLHLRDADENLLYEQKKEIVDGVETDVDDKDKPIGITLYGPGSKVHAKANAVKHNALMDRYKKKGKADQSAEEIAEENAIFLAACTKQFHHIERDQLQGEALYKAIYTDRTIGYVAEQALKHLGEWGNFTKGSTTTSPSTSAL